jgi:hypothetical protein
VRFLFQGGLAQKFSLFVVRGERALLLRLVTFLVAILCRFHPANCHVGSGCAREPAIETAAPIIFQLRRLCPKLAQFVFPAHRVALFRFRHAQEDAAAFFRPAHPLPGRGKPGRSHAPRASWPGVFRPPLPLPVSFL